MPAEQAIEQLGLITRIRAMQHTVPPSGCRNSGAIDADRYARSTDSAKDPIDGMTLTRWQPDRSTPKPPWPVPSLATAIGRGLLGRCPACGEGRMFNGFLRVVPECRALRRAARPGARRRRAALFHHPHRRPHRDPRDAADAEAR